MRWRFEIVVETEADLTTTSVQEGSYPDEHFVDAMFATAIARYEADQKGRILSFKIEKAEKTN